MPYRQQGSRTTNPFINGGIALTNSVTDEQEIAVAKQILTAVTDMFEVVGKTSQAMEFGTEEQDARICVFATVIPTEHIRDYMDHMIALHSILVKEYLEVISTRPSRSNPERLN